MINKIYVKHIYNIFDKIYLYYINIFITYFYFKYFEELKFFTNVGISNISLPILLTVLNLPSLLFEIFLII